MRTNAITEKDLMFMRLVVNNTNKAEAYNQAYQPRSTKNLMVCAATKLAKPHIKEAMQKMQEEINAKMLNATVWSRQDSINTLAEIIKVTQEDWPLDDEGKKQYSYNRSNTIMQAVDKLNTMHGYNAPTAHVVTSVKLEDLINDSKTDYTTTAKVLDEQSG